MTTLSGFEEGLREAVMDDAEREVAAATDTLADESARNFQQYASRNDYDIEHIWQDIDVSGVRRTTNTARATVSWPGLTALFEYGVDPHVIEGNPLLAFYWEAVGEFIVTESVNWGSRTGGIPESRAIRAALAMVRRDLGGSP